MIRIQCPVCNATMSAADSEAGRKGACPKCGQRLQLPPARPPARNSLHAQVSETVPQPRPLGGEPYSVPPSRFRPFVLGIVCGLLVGLVTGTAATLGIVGVRGTRTDEAKRVAGPAADQPGAKAGPAGADAAQPLAAGMTREEFRAKLKALKNEDWPGEQHVAPRSKKGLIRAFGQPTRTQTLGDRLSWFWQCKDGTVQIVFRAGSGYINDDFLDQIEVNDW